MFYLQSNGRIDDDLGSLGGDALDGLDLFDFPDDVEEGDKKRRQSNRPSSSNQPSSSSSSSSGLFNSPPRSVASASPSSVQGKAPVGGVQSSGGGRGNMPAPKMEGM